jgi:hypothetical protein
MKFKLQLCLSTAVGEHGVADAVFDTTFLGHGDVAPQPVDTSAICRRSARTGWSATPTRATLTR